MSKNKRSQVPDEPEVRLPFPPKITAREVISDKKNGKKAKKPPNAFMIYRKVFSRELAKKNLRFQQKKISTLCSISWKQEPENVKQGYRRLAHDADKIFLQDLQNHSQSPQLHLPLPPQQMLPPSQLLQSEMDKHLKCFDDMERQMLPPSQLLQSEMDKHLKCFDDMERQMFPPSQLLQSEMDNHLKCFEDMERQMFPPSQLLQSEMDNHLKYFDDMERQQETQSIVPSTLDSLDVNQGYIQQSYYPIYGPTDPTFFEENYYYFH
ncbi:unnamed protein product [Rhizophagus irregularis]|uniref:MATA-HMG n=1 Tax=Rhizophagus irregularis TaxID=588596 RepID=A0A1B1EU64_9GLOM|nr:MATA-HMG [Rhizophagus irregularis]PKK77791.1 hypothetical protein RhiirC2_807471 [Rhizophagus irregularis]CAB4391403.1 unnamed protein product [Rhizophagus irregularis]CAB5390843.1 unnamed protein product [Rhizophagus irregularis]